MIRKDPMKMTAMAKLFIKTILREIKIALGTHCQIILLDYQ